MRRAYMIAEIGQNHNGDVDKAIKIIEYVSEPVWDDFSFEFRPGWDAVKITVRDLEQEMDESLANQKYDNEHSHGKTYMEHRKALELSEDDIRLISEQAKFCEIDLIVTCCNPGAIDKIKDIPVDGLKIASRDLINRPLIKAMAKEAAKRNVPLYISSGMYSDRDLVSALSLAKMFVEDGNKLVPFHCVSKYPTPYSEVNIGRLDQVRGYADNLGIKRIGYSDHTIGLVASVLAFSRGADVIEKHVTFDRKARGRDHLGALGYEGMDRLVRDIRNAEMMLANNGIVSPIIDKKLARSVAYNNNFDAGHLLCDTDFCMVSPGSGIMDWNEINKFSGYRLSNPVKKNQLIKYSDIGL